MLKYWIQILGLALVAGTPLVAAASPGKLSHARAHQTRPSRLHARAHSSPSQAELDTVNDDLGYKELEQQMNASPSYQALAAASQGYVLSERQTKAGYQAAILSYLKSAALYGSIGKKKEQAGSLSGAADCYRLLGQPQKALEAWQKALALSQEAGDKSGQALMLSSIGDVYGETGQPQKALEYYKRSLPLSHVVGNKAQEASTLMTIGNVYRDTGQPQKALENLELALSLTEKVETEKAGSVEVPGLKDSLEAEVLSNIGIVYAEIGQPQKALPYFEKAYSLSWVVSNKQGQADDLILLGNAYWDLRQPQKALEYYKKALPLTKELGDKTGEANIWIDAGLMYSDGGEPQKALVNLEAALLLSQEVSDKNLEATTLSSIGSAYKDSGQLQKALDYYTKALPLEQEVGDRSGQASTLTHSAGIQVQLKQEKQARDSYEKALDLVDSIVGGITRDELKRAAAESYQWIYQSYIDFLLRQENREDTGRALEVSEQARSRALRDLLAGNLSQLPSASLMKGERLAGAQLTGVNSSPLSHPNTSTQELASSLNRGSALDTSRAMHSVALSVEDLPALATTGQARKFQREEASQSAVDGPVLSYYLLQKDLAIFVIEPSGEIHAVRSSVKPAELLKLTQQARLGITATDDPEETRDNLRKLYDVLVKPVEQWLQPSLTMVPFGPLFQVPFPALVSPDGKYLIEHYSLRIAPSLTVLRYTRQRQASLKGAPMNALLFGDPVMPQGVPELPGALEEVKRVAAELKAGQPRTRGLATEMAFRREAPEATEIHLATHGYMSDNQPLLSGIILAPSEGKEPTYQRDGFLTVAEVFRLHLNARLVTLSACKTGLGATGADGVFGLQSAFLTAGSASLLSTLWEVNDQATSTLMETFYRGVEADPQHDRAKALREAQLSLLNSKGFSKPAYWAAFELTGEER